MKFSNEVTFKLIDKGVLEVFGPFAITKIFYTFAANVSKVTSGYIFHYSFIIL